MPDDRIVHQTRAVVAAVAARLGLPAQDARLLHSHSNDSFLLPSAHVVVRIASNPDALHRVTASIAVTRWLAGRGFPCVVPADIGGQPLVEDGRVVSVWQYVPTAPAPPPSAAELGSLLYDLHHQAGMLEPPPRLDDPFASVARAIGQARQAIDEASRQWLISRIASLRDRWSQLDFAWPASMIHGDAHIGNLMRAQAGQSILGDWDHVATGPREWDLIQVHYTSRRFGRPAGREIEAFTAAYGWDIRDWPGLATLVAIREITGLSPYIRAAHSRQFSRSELARRLRSLQEDNQAMSWSPPPAP